MVTISFTDFVNDSVRILILLNATKVQNSSCMTDRRIMLFDYYIKFPNTMLSDIEQSSHELQTLDEYYAFFHWQPDIIRYRQSLNYLMAKGFIEKSVENKNPVYKITDCGQGVVEKINSSYKTRLETIISDVLPLISKLSDARIENQIRAKSNILLRNGGGYNEKKIKD